MSTTMESKSASDTREHPTNSRVSSFDVRPSVAGMIADSDGNLDEKKAVAALSQTREQNKHMWIGCFVLIGVVFILIAANIGTSVAVARLTRQLNVDPVTGMAMIPGSDDVVMKTSTALFKEKGVNFHFVPTKYLSTVESVDLFDGNLSLDVKGFARMSNITILLVEGGSLIFDIIGLKNITGDELTRLFSSIGEDIDGRKLFSFTMPWGSKINVNAVAVYPPHSRCGPSWGWCKEDLPWCNERSYQCGSDIITFKHAQPSVRYDWECSESQRVHEVECFIDQYLTPMDWGEQHPPVYDVHGFLLHDWSF